MLRTRAAVAVRLRLLLAPDLLDQHLEVGELDREAQMRKMKFILMEIVMNSPTLSTLSGIFKVDSASTGKNCFLHSEHPRRNHWLMVGEPWRPI